MSRKLLVGVGIALLTVSSSLYAGAIRVKEDKVVSSDSTKYLSFEEAPCHSEFGTDGQCEDVQAYFKNVGHPNENVTRIEFTEKARENKKRKRKLTEEEFDEFAIVTISPNGLVEKFREELKGRRLDKQVRDALARCRGSLSEYGYMRANNFIYDFEEGNIDADEFKKQIGNLIAILNKYRDVHKDNKNGLCYNFTRDKMAIGLTEIVKVIDQKTDKEKEVERHVMVDYKGGAVQYIIDGLNKVLEKKLTNQ